MNSKSLEVYCPECASGTPCGAAHRALIAWLQSRVSQDVKSHGELNRSRALARAKRIAPVPAQPRIEHRPSAPLSTLKAKLLDALLKNAERER